MLAASAAATLWSRSVRVTAAQEMLGTALGISPTGALLLRTQDGRLQTVTSGTVRIAG